MRQSNTWQFVSVVATGTAPNTTNGATPIWEPFLLYHDGELGVFYSDQRDPLLGQKLAHQQSRDLVNWGSVINDVAMSNYTLRPGMTTIAQIGEGKTARIMLSYELGMAPGPVDYAVGYRISDSPFTFGSAPDMQLVATDGTIPAAGPYTVPRPGLRLGHSISRVLYIIVRDIPGHLSYLIIHDYCTSSSRLYDFLNEYD
ncbi:glycoside hydrolase family 93 protein [Sphaerobolus stellatus SS14]|uniref:Glycoside hydrolase family 93 protein n=1 Tax=Sphaerobolus stellatus (strain SS14) TaxID=990650 RepID=A0A0C9UZV7_SPHS4|nr:glycoside hydrolase family 93 protein [Sphaerobolus stellatus SS14]